MTDTEPTLTYTYSNGLGRWFGQCVGCRRSSPTWPAPDGLRLLALATGAGWRAERRADGRHLLRCPACVRLRPHVTG
jgi:hypothetical protein